MYQQWHHLLFLHWKIEQDQLRKAIPTELEIDTFDGDAYVGLVLFTMKGIRPNFLPRMPFASAFHEFNLRTYVRRGDKTGVWFFSLDAGNALAVRAARSLYSLPYYFSRMSVDVRENSLEYKSERLWPGPLPAIVDTGVTVSGNPKPSTPGAIEYYFVERYKLFTNHRGRVLELNVEHDPYLLSPTANVQIEETLTTAAGLTVSGPPIAHYSARVDADILRLGRE